MGNSESGHCVREPRDYFLSIKDEAANEAV